MVHGEVRGQDAKGALPWASSLMPGRWQTSPQAEFAPFLGAREGASRYFWVQRHFCKDPLTVPTLEDTSVHVPRREKIVSMEFMRKYIHVAKMIKPVLTQESASYIAEEYSRLRNQSQMNSDIARVSPGSSSLSHRETGN